MYISKDSCIAFFEIQLQIVVGCGPDSFPSAIGKWKMQCDIQERVLC